MKHPIKSIAAPTSRSRTRSARALVDIRIGKVEAQDGVVSAPLQLQAVDVLGLSLFTEPVRLSGGPGEQRVGGGCHEDPRV